jgi:hypothetical protein
MTDELNRHNDPTGLLQSARAATGSKPYLGSIDGIDSLIRTFAGGVIDRFDKVGHGILTPNDAADADRAECIRLAGIMVGLDDSFAPMPGWTDGGLAAYVRARMSEAVTPDEPDAEVVAQAFASFVHSIYDTLGNISDMDAPSDDDLAKINDHVRSLTWLLVGIESNE